MDGDCQGTKSRTRPVQPWWPSAHQHQSLVNMKLDRTMDFDPRFKFKTSKGAVCCDMKLRPIDI